MARGYRNYRGRASKGKAALAVLLVCIIIAALSALAMQRYVAYDENGAPFFRLPERQTRRNRRTPRPCRSRSLRTVWRSSCRSRRPRPCFRCTL